MSKQIRVGLVGYQFMGKAHSHAYRDASMFFDLPVTPVMQVLCGLGDEELRKAGAQYGWAEVEPDWRRLVERPDIDLIDICTPNFTHAEIAKEAIAHGKHVLCEKPLATSAALSREMLTAAQRAGISHMISHNYRFAPAVQLARQLIASGRLGEIRHIRATYLQDWIVDPNHPMVWRFKKELAGSGALGDLAAHSVDLARFLVGEITEVTGTLKTYIKERPVAGAASPDQRDTVTVDDQAIFLARFENGALGTFEATRLAAGNRNGNRFEINGSNGSVRWDMENMNYLHVFFQDDPVGLQGWRAIQVTEPVHPYAGNWWPAGHIIGYEHTFVHVVVEMLKGIHEGRAPTPNFEDGHRNQLVLEAVEQSDATGSWVKVPNF